ncbi:rust resistance kinase Lr10-like isoform X2 [Prunus avium]|uniref:Rust resistance kinase Lr10-like isoform X2 n=1 Tax=Prunus avium TaxID=42229 RepID=A0A6P5RFJ2_PRUAV|nr:rust resistance kinase Lr10-like isoform X2 [Prunus avium]
MQRFLISCLCILYMVFVKAVGAGQDTCTESKCSDDHGLAIHFPLHLRHHCGDPGLECNGRQEKVLEQQVALIKFFVKSIDYKRGLIEVYNPDGCLLLMPLETANIPISPLNLLDYEIRNVTLFNCPTPRRLPAERDIYQVPCLRGGPGYRVHGIYSDDDLFYSLPHLKSCTRMYDVLSVPFPTWDLGARGYSSILRFKWSKPNCTKCEARGKRCRLKDNGINSEVECFHPRKASKTMEFVATGASLGSSLLLVLVIAVYRVYSADQKEKEHQLKIERFLEDYKALKPSRYSYADIKRITNQFKDKLGEGAYGTVFKGKLSSEFFVAVKVLNNSKGNGEEFVNEVGMMGHIHHVNVVRLVGFCADGFRRALVYEFFPNGSLQDFISSADSKNSFLGWEKLHDIAVGIAKGIEYLHQGCDQRILHFDIKPHNVLLDHNFTPKISDFGLAKLCSKDQSIVSMTTARGTMGYIAPEVFSRNFGIVSYKSDVYSFGMLLLEMVGGRKNIGSSTKNTDEIYYPEWIYNLLEGGDDLRIHIGDDGDGKIPKTLAIVGLWCIQWHPVDRPSMQIVVRMLEGGDNLVMPPNPFVSAGPTTTHASIPARRLELEAIPELE